jgi:hypothetical protein
VALPLEKKERQLYSFSPFSELDIMEIGELFLNFEWQIVIQPDKLYTQYNAIEDIL